MIDEIFDRQYQAGRNDLHDGIDRLVAMLPALLLALYAVWTSSPWGVALEQRLGLEMLFQLRGERPAPPATAISPCPR